MTVLVALEGVLKSDTKMVREGRILYDILISGTKRVVILANEPPAMVEHWLAQNGFRGYAGILTPSVSVDDDEPLRQRQISVARAMGHVDLIIDADPETIKHCLDIEVPGLLFAHAKTARPDWRPDSPKRTWDEITAQIERKKTKEASE
jgi:hypothetical protein